MNIYRPGPYREKRILRDRNHFEILVGPKNNIFLYSKSDDLHTTILKKMKNQVVSVTYKYNRQTYDQVQSEKLP